jgi:hypothetical protein
MQHITTTAVMKGSRVGYSFHSVTGDYAEFTDATPRRDGIAALKRATAARRGAR